MTTAATERDLLAEAHEYADEIAKGKGGREACGEAAANITRNRGQTHEPA